MNPLYLPKIAVIIAVHNGLLFTRRCLDALQAQAEAEFEIVVVDDGSTDGTAAFLHEHHADVKVLPGTGKLWWSGATNVACKHAISHGAEVVVLFNNDNVECSPNLIRRLSELASSTGDCVSAVALMERPNGSRVILHAGGTIDWRGRGGQLLETGNRYVSEERVVECDWLPGTAVALTADTYLALGGADERRFPQYRGDIDLTLRARNLGRRCLVARNIWVMNDREQSGLSFDRRLSVRDIAAGFISLRSPYNLREAVGFAVRHCPVRFIPHYLIRYYARYVYACLKTRYPSISRLRSILSGFAESGRSK